MLTFTAAATTGEGTVTPDLSWSTSPVAPGATPCVASNSTATRFPNWNGPKAASGRQTLAATDVNVTFTLRCTWPGDASIVTFTWRNPTTNTTGTPYINPKLTRIKYTFNPALTTNPAVAANGEVHVDVSQTPEVRTTHSVTNVSGIGTFRANVFAQNTDNAWSAPSNLATRSFTGTVSDVKAIELAVNPKPNPPTGFVIE